MFKTIELGAWYRIRWEGKSIFGKALERHRNSYTFRYAEEKGKVRTAKVARSDVVGRLGDHLIPDLELAITPAKHRKTAEAKVKAVSPGRLSTVGKSTQEQLAPEPPKKMPRPSKSSTTRKKRKPSKGQGLLFPE